jgi:hypothetical protein
MHHPLLLCWIAGLTFAVTGTGTPACAQSVGGTGTPRAERPAGAARNRRAAGTPTRDVDSLSLKPPVTPRRAFLYSLAIPGAGQAALERHFWGGAFFLAEGLSLALVYRSAEDLRLARHFRADSVPETYQVDASGQPILGGDGRPAVATWTVSRYSAARVRARRTHYEDWLAVLVFNHLIAGADAYVAAQLWDLPARVGVRTAPDGQPAVVASLRFR